MDEDDKSSVTDFPPPEFPNFSVQQLMENGTRLLASSGKEFSKPTGIFKDAAEVKKARKAAMNRLGLGFLEVADDDEMDLEKELVNSEDADAEMETAKDEFGDRTKLSPPVDGVQTPFKESSPVDRTNSATPGPPEDFSALSARERNRLKRKRKGGNSAVVCAPPPQNSGSKYSTTPVGGSSSKYVSLLIFLASLNCAYICLSIRARLVAPDPQGNKSRLNGSKDSSPDRAVVDPTKGGAVEAKAGSSQNSKALEVQPGHWVWDGVVKVLEVDLFSHSWEVRHGAAMGLREVLKNQGKCGGMKGVPFELTD